MAITATNGINQAEFVNIGGTDQWIQIRGHNRDNPAILWINGGPGFTTIPQTFFYTPWERDFTVVMWDQRGEGKSFHRSGPSVASTMSIERMAQDGIEVAEYLRDQVGLKSIILVGHSWGSILGVRMALARPDLFSAYVGTGQVVNLQRSLGLTYHLVMEKARAEKIEDAIAQLSDAGPPPYADPAKTWTLIRWANQLDPPPASSRTRPTWPGIWAILNLTLLAEPAVKSGAVFSQEVMLDAMLAEEIESHGVRFGLPVVFIQGAGDLVTPTKLVEEYFSRIEAPQKAILIMAEAGHLAIFRNGTTFLQLLRNHVLPVFQDNPALH